MMKKIHLIYKNFLNANNNLQIGGIETYLFHLAQVLTSAGYQVNVIQEGEAECQVDLPYASVHKVRCCSKDPYVDLVKYAEAKFNGDGCIIFGAHTAIRRSLFEKTIAIQHGIHWDGIEIPRIPKRFACLYPIARFIEARKTIKLVSAVRSVVCVDYNFVNWLRTQGCLKSPRLRVIPNFVDTQQVPARCGVRSNDEVKIVFARRFVERRGVKLLAAVLPGIIESYPNVSLTIAGEGPMEGFLREAFRGQDRVSFTKYLAQDSIEFHSQFDIAIVPTIFSEGTSFSLLEAMYSGCCVLCSNVGGMTNIVLDGFNGRMVAPEESSFSQALDSLIENGELRRYLAENAISSVAGAFSLRAWESRWIEVVEGVFNEDR